MSVALAEADPAGGLVLYRFVADVRRPEVPRPLADLLRRPMPFVVHSAAGDLYCLAALGLPEPRTVWDTCVAERTFHLGVDHRRNEDTAFEDDAEEAIAAGEVQERREGRLNLTAVCERYGVEYFFGGDKERLQRSFLSHGDDQSFSGEQVGYAAADAAAVAALYLPQIHAATLAGCLYHLVTVEMPFVAPAAGMTRTGVGFDREIAARVRQSAGLNAERFEAELAAEGLANVNSHPQMRAYFERLGLLELFVAGRGTYNFTDKRLKEAEAAHPSIAKIRTARKLRKLLSDKLFSGVLLGGDGRLHPTHHVLGAESGRASCSRPNVAGVGKALRPVVLPAPGYALGEVDLSQIEPGIAGADSGDQRLVVAFNSGDVYAAMVKAVLADEMDPADRDLPDAEVKRRYGHLRDRMKTLTLAMLYGQGDAGVAAQLGVSEARARAERERFFATFPHLERGIRDAIASGSIRGYAETATGLRRYRGRTGALTSWERNWMRNVPVQGSAAAAFKTAVGRLWLLLPAYGAKMVLPVHDALVFEAPPDRLREVAELIGQVLSQAVRELLPQLRPRFEFNDADTCCWSKDGRSDSLDRFCENPLDPFGR